MAEPPTRDELRRAMKAFKKRLKVMRLDDESKLGGGPLSSGRDSGLVAIRPPDTFPQEVWDALVAQGRLEEEGHGLYAIVPQPQ